MVFGDMSTSSTEDGILIGTVQKKRTASKTRDRNAEKFWSVFDAVAAVCKLKAANAKWGKRKIAAQLAEQNTTVTESQVQRYCETFLFDLEEDRLFYRSTELHEIHRR